MSVCLCVDSATNLLIIFPFFVRGVNCDPWSSVAELATILRGFGPPDVPLTDAVSADAVPVKLMEDSFLRGYEPLLPAHRTLSYSPSHIHSVSYLLSGICGSFGS